MKVVVAGDLCMRNLSGVLDEDYSKKVLKKIMPVINQGDLKVINLENPLLDGGNPIHKSGPPLKGSPEDIVFLKEGGFNCACLANNHIGDYGDEGVISTLKVLEENGIGHMGAGRNIEEAYEPFYYKGKDSTVAVIGVCENEFGIAEEDRPGSAGFDTYRVQKTIGEASKKADHVLVIMHGGNEYCPVPSPMIMNLYRTFAGMGADCVVGMHPHCIQGYEYHGKTPIIYSTGNFLFKTASGAGEKSPWYYGYVPVITFEKGKDPSLEIHPYRYDLECTEISPFQGEEKKRMMEYIKEISLPLADEEHIKNLFKGWCIISGIDHARRLNFKEDFLNGTIFPTGHPLLPMRNILTCESHCNMVKTTLKMMADGKLEEGRNMVEELKRLQKMPV